MKSMTGFGIGEYKDENREIIIEIKTINHRYRDFFIRMPRQLNSLEEKIRNLVSKNIHRGRIEINIKFNSFNIGTQNLKLNEELAKNYIDVLKELKNMNNDLSGDVSLSLVARFPEIITSEEEKLNIEEIWEHLSNALNKVINQIIISRQNEGNNLKVDFDKRCKKIQETLTIIEGQAPIIVQNYRDKLKDRVKEFLSGVEIDESRLLTEVAVFAEKVNITEEIIRLQSHISRFKQIIEEKEPIGRKLDFLIQEMNREINTIGSKANDITTSNCVVNIKSELEKIREQVQNIE